MESRIVFVDKKLKNAFLELKKSDKKLYNEICKSIEDIRHHAWVGRNVKKKLIPKSLKNKYGIDNLWIYNLSKDWRLLYSLGKDEIELLAVVLDWMNHKDYERLFNF